MDIGYMAMMVQSEIEDELDQTKSDTDLVKMAALQSFKMFNITNVVASKIGVEVFKLYEEVV